MPPEGIEHDIEAMRAWWLKLAETDADTTVPKAIEYGSSDLKLMGAAMAEMLHLEGADDYERNVRGQQAAVVFYMLGKLGRIISALGDDRPINPDHNFDIRIYSTMFERITQTGQWP